MNTSHTPGPWHVNSTEAHGEACAYAAVIIGPESAGSPCIASLEFGGTIETDSETTKANARLIAAAPDTAASHDRLRDALNVAVMLYEHPNAGSRSDWAANAKAILAGTPDTETDRLRAINAELLGACRSGLRALQDNLQPGPMDEDAKAGLSAAIANAEGQK